MIVGGEELFSRSLLKHAKESNFKNASYYLSIGAIVPIGDPEKSNFLFGTGPETFTLKPKEMVWVISKEEFCFDAFTVFGLATLRTTLTKSGLLALNTGVIDPNFSGPIGTAIINFSSLPFPLKRGDQFMRVIFFKHEPILEKFRQAPMRYSAKSYLEDVQKNALAAFPRNFLDAKELSDEFYKELEKKMAGYFVNKYWWAIALALILLIPSLPDRIDAIFNSITGANSTPEESKPASVKQDRPQDAVPPATPGN